MRLIKVDIILAVIFGLVLAVSATVLGTVGVLLLQGVPYDLAVPWFAGQTWVAGMVPHVDVPSPLGAGYFLIHGLGYEAAGGTAITPVFGNLWALAFTLPLMGWILFSRLEAMPAAAALLFFGLWMISPRQVDLDLKDFGHLASYNRHGMVWMGLILLGSALPARGAASGRIGWTGRIDILVVVLLLVYCLMTKITFFAAVAPFTGIALILRYRRDPLALAAMVGGYVIVFLGVLGLVELARPGMLMAYVRDISYAASIQQGGAFGTRLFANLGSAALYFLFDVMTAAILLGGAMQRYGRPRLLLRPVLVALAGLMSLLFAKMQMHDIYAPIFVIAALLFYATLRREALKAEREPADPLDLSWLVLPCLLVPATIETMCILQYKFYTMRIESAPTEYMGFQDARLFFGSKGSGIRAYQGDGSDPSSSLSQVQSGIITLSDWNKTGNYGFREFVDVNQDAVDLLDRHGRPDRVFCMDFSNYCTVLTGTIPAAGLMPWWHSGRSYGIDIPPTPHLDDVAAVLIPGPDRFGFARDLAEAYAETIAQDFVQTDQSRYWTFYERRQ